jgi:hypothetical protein
VNHLVPFSNSLNQSLERFLWAAIWNSPPERETLISRGSDKVLKSITYDFLFHFLFNVFGELVECLLDVDGGLRGGLHELDRIFAGELFAALSRHLKRRTPPFTKEPKISRSLDPRIPAACPSCRTCCRESSSRRPRKRVPRCCESSF